MLHEAVFLFVRECRPQQPIFGIKIINFHERTIRKTSVVTKWLLRLQDKLLKFFIKKMCIRRWLLRSPS
jgi:hypothetical protein